MLLLLLGSRTRPEAAGTNHTHSRARPSRRSAGSARRRKPAGSLPTFYHTFACMERGSLFSRFFGALGLASLAPLSGANNAGAGFRQPPQRDPIFRDAKFFCFGAINNRRNYWWGISFFVVTVKGGAKPISVSRTYRLLYQSRYGAAEIVISKVLIPTIRRVRGRSQLQRRSHSCHGRHPG